LLQLLTEFPLFALKKRHFLSLSPAANGHSPIRPLAGKFQFRHAA
jgi:hypothetical protein